MLALIGEENIFLATPRLGEAMNQAATAAHAWLAGGSLKTQTGGWKPTG